MLKALKSQLSLLAIENGADYVKHVKKRLGRGRKAELHVSRSLNLILTMPDMIARIRDLSDGRDVPKSLRPLNGFLLTYLYHPIDFLPDEGSGLFGYLDDAYFVGQVYGRIKRYLMEPKSAADLSRDLPEALELTREILPKETRLIDRLIEELVDGKRDLFDRLMKREAHS
jgi:uncharacterized membrane protein YkvA (DUF1232 family)